MVTELTSQRINVKLKGANNMTEPVSPIVVFGTIVLALILFGALVVLNVIPVPGVDSPYQIEEGEIVKEIESESEVDLRLVALPYLTTTDVQEICIEVGGVWHNEANFVGCEGYGPTYCNTPLVTSAMTQCLGAGGNWTCGHNGIYCSI